MKLELIRNIGSGGFGFVDEVFNENKEIFARKTFQVNQPNGFSVSVAWYFTHVG